MVLECNFHLMTGNLNAHSIIRAGAYRYDNDSGISWISSAILFPNSNMTEQFTNDIQSYFNIFNPKMVLQWLHLIHDGHKSGLFILLAQDSDVVLRISLHIPRCDSTYSTSEWDMLNDVWLCAKRCAVEEYHHVTILNN